MPGDAFETLGILPGFDLDRSEVERAYLALASRLHPDLAKGSDDAARQMADLNRARRVLENPELRADALLHRLGGPSAENERSLPPGFLAQMLLTREELEAALHQIDSAACAAAKADWERWSREQREQAIQRASSLFAGLPPDSNRPDALRAIRVHLNSWRYLERLIEQLDPAQTICPAP